MGSQRHRPQPKVEHTDGLTTITFTGGKRTEENMIAHELEGLTDDLGQRHLVLDFSDVSFITNIELGTLIKLHKKMKASGGRLTLNCVNPQICEVFTITKLHTFMDIRQRLEHTEQLMQKQVEVVTETKELMKGVKEEVKEIRQDLREVKEEVKEIRQDLREVKQNQSGTEPPNEPA